MRLKAALVALVCAATVSVAPNALAAQARLVGASGAVAASDESDGCVGSTIDQTHIVGDSETSQVGNPGWGPVTSDAPTTARHQDGRIELYVLSAGDSMLWKKTENRPGSVDWGPWTEAGAPALACRIAVGYNADGRIELFGIRADNREVWHSWQTSANGGFSPWQRFSGPAADVTVGTNADGRLEVFARNPSTLEVYHVFQVAPSSGWSGWSKFWGPAGSVAVGENADGRMEFFATDPVTLEVFNAFQVRQSGTWSSKRAFGGRTALDLRVGQNFDGRQHLFVREPGTTHVYAVSQIGQNQPWTTWQQIGGPSAGISVGLNPFGMFVFSLDPTTREPWQARAENAGYGSWSVVGNRPLASPPTQAFLFDSADPFAHQCCLFGAGTDGKIWYSIIISPWGDYRLWAPDWLIMSQP